MGFLNYIVNSLNLSKKPLFKRDDVIIEKDNLRAWYRTIYKVEGTTPCGKVYLLSYGDNNQHNVDLTVLYVDSDYKLYKEGEVS